MIRIDEIYSHTFWPFIQRNVPLTRLFFCDPFGHTQPQNLFNLGHDVCEHNFVYCHDQEPLYEDVHSMLFSEVARRNLDLNHSQGPKNAGIIVSEKHSDIVTQVCSAYQWQPYYYFFNGWAALDWYRGYDKTFLLTSFDEKRPSRVFFMPNRIVDGRRDHRILLMYHVLRSRLTNIWASFPAICPETQRPVSEISKKFLSLYPDISDVFNAAELPMHLRGECDHPMHSCWLSRFDLVADCEIYVVTETVAHGARLHLTEKIFKPICMQIPFILLSTAGSLRYLRSYGFKTFHEFWDESYDDEPDDILRIEAVARLMKDIYDMPVTTRRDIIQATRDVVMHNYQHFYHGGFEHLLWQEFQGMLLEIKRDFNGFTD